MLSRGKRREKGRKCVKSPQNEPLVMGKGKRKKEKGGGERKKGEWKEILAYIT